MEGQWADRRSLERRPPRESVYRKRFCFIYNTIVEVHMLAVHREGGYESATHLLLALSIESKLMAVVVGLPSG